MSVFSSVPSVPPDPIIGVNDAFNQDTHPNKLNLGVGAYRDEQGRPWVLPVVQEIEQRLVESRTFDKEYLPITGLKDFCTETRKLILGPKSPSIAADRVATIQTLSGTGALAVAMVFIRRFFPGSPVVYLSNPTWANHKNLCTGNGLPMAEYRYYDPKTRGLDFDGMIADLSAAPSGSVILLHVCAHNPTGVDPTPAQWAEILQLFKQKKLYPFFDCAYQGFASGDLAKDSYAVRLFDEAGLEFLVCQSYAKNFGLYGERIGALNFVLDSPETVKNVLGQVSKIIRQIYSSPPRHGAEIVATCLKDPVLFEKWTVSLSLMANRIMEMRQTLLRELQALNAPGSWQHIVEQIGMFTFTGLTPEQVSRLTSVHHVYLTSDGRISMAGLNAQGCKYLAAAIVEVVNAIPSKY